MVLVDTTEINSFASNPQQSGFERPSEQLIVLAKGNIPHAQTPQIIGLSKEYANLAYRAMEQFEIRLKLLKNGRNELRLRLRNELLEHGYDPLLGIQIILAFADEVAKYTKTQAVKT